MRVLVILLLALTCMGQATQLLAEEPPLPANLTAAIGQEQILGFDFLSDIHSSTSDCLGSIQTVPCAVATRLACYYWRDPHACMLTDVSANWAAVQTMPEYGDRDTYRRIRYVIAAAIRMDETLSLPWMGQPEPGFQNLRVRFESESKVPAREGDIITLVRERQCRPGGPACVASMSFDQDIYRDICIRVEPCNDYPDILALIWRQETDGWRPVQLWFFDEGELGAPLN